MLIIQLIFPQHAWLAFDKNAFQGVLYVLFGSNRTEVFRQSRRQLLLPTYLYCPFREFRVLGTYSWRIKRFRWKLISLPVSISLCSPMPVAKPESEIVSWSWTWLSLASFLTSNHRDRFLGLPVRIITHYNFRLFHIKASWSNLPNRIALRRG